MRKLLLLSPIVLIVMLGLLFMRGLSLNPQELPSALVGEMVPEFQLSSLLKESKILTNDIFVGEKSLLNIWATWCLACKAEHAKLVALADDSVRVIGLNYKDKRPAAVQWLNDLGDPYRLTIFDEDGTLGFDLGVYGAPETYIIDAAGIIHYRHAGPIDDGVWRNMKKIYDSI
ncbi:DsbE family thiol:disulfide interchange protein [Oceanospirillaceae bacterium]|nr:DsbE family thiol:disulfide interchange protein [Oceanospirillaceae bacterium]